MQIKKIKTNTVTIVLLLVLFFLVLLKEFLGLTLLKDHWYFYLIGGIIIPQANNLSKKMPRLKKVFVAIYWVVGAYIIIPMVLGIGISKQYNYTYSPDFEHKIVLKEVTLARKRDGSIVEICEQFGFFKKSKGSISISDFGHPLTMELMRRSGHVFKPKEEFAISGVIFHWETNDILKIAYVGCDYDIPEEVDRMTETIVFK